MSGCLHKHATTLLGALNRQQSDNTPSLRVHILMNFSKLCISSIDFECLQAIRSNSVENWTFCHFSRHNHSSFFDIFLCLFAINALGHALQNSLQIYCWKLYHGDCALKNDWIKMRIAYKYSVNPVAYTVNALTIKACTCRTQSVWMEYRILPLAQWVLKCECCEY